MSSAPAPGPRLVSRKAELSALWSAVDRASAGQSATVLVAGDAGVGKSRLVLEFADAAQGDGVLALLGRCVEVGDGGLPYAPVAEALRSLAAQLGPAELEEALGPARAELARLVPDLGDADAAPDGSPTAFGKARLFEMVLATLGRLGARRPVLLVIEDLHWADASTRDLLRFLVRSAVAERLAVVATYRTDDLHQAHPLRPYLVELRRDPRVSGVRLHPFSSAEFASHVAEVLGAVPPAAVLDRLFERSEGNAFFTEELLSAARGEASADLPASLRDAMLAHLDRLSEPARQVVRAVAAAGRRVEHRLIARIAGLPGGELSAALREAVGAQVLVPAADGGAYEFRHALLREAAYAEVLPGEREGLHARLARELEAEPELAGASPSPAAELAHHWQAAGEREVALAASVRAGTQAERAYAHPEALRHFRRALELSKRVPQAAREGVDAVQITASAARAANATGEHQLAIALAERAITLVDARTEPLRAGVLHARLAHCLQDAGRGDEARRRSARAVELMPPESSPERARVLEAHARLLSLGGREHEARAPIEEAIAVARALGLRDVEAAALTTSVITLRGRTEEAVAAGHEALLAAREAGEPETLVRAYVNAAAALEQAGRVQEAIDLAREGVDVSRRAGVERVLGAHLKGEIAGRLVKLGRLGEAATVIEDAVRAAPSGTAAASLHQAAAAIAARRGDADGTRAATRLVRANAVAAGGDMWSARSAAATAELELWRGDAARARTVVEDALAQVEGADLLLTSAALYTLGAWAHADEGLRARGLRRHAQAEDARAAVLALGARFDAQLIGGPAPELAAHRAQLAAELGRLEVPPDAGAWEAARRRWDALGFRFEVALCAWREAEALLAGEGDGARVAELLGRAHREARAIGARPLVAQVEALGRHAAGAGPAP